MVTMGIPFSAHRKVPSVAPGTGTPEPGGLMASQGVEIIRGCWGLNMIGCDLVEVSPPYDTTGNTALVAANLVFALFFTQPMPTWENFIPVVFLSGDNIGFVIAGTLVGGTIAMFTFAVSAVSAPMLMDRQVDVITAMRTSLNAVLANWRPMLLWAALIAMFVGIGIVTFYAGLLVAMPLVGHATWHAYRDLVAQD